MTENMSTGHHIIMRTYVEPMGTVREPMQEIRFVFFSIMTEVLDVRVSSSKINNTKI